MPILDASRVTVQGDGLHQVAVGKQSQFRVTTQSAGDADLKVRVTGNWSSTYSNIITQLASDARFASQISQLLEAILTAWY